jgi:DNA-directed RNA polymerase specialized sigma24 family protein
LLDKLGSEELRRLALLRMEGYSREEIGEQFGWSVPTVDRKLKVIRTLWKEWDPAERQA